ncbi:uncharacterized protein [Phyllobates terribilis]|uniref:uncharacterized protein isoform X2 n=1 Tax=Phyllobates terribilis TaxID=111132 RepID=UPI003CCB38DF
MAPTPPGIVETPRSRKASSMEEKPDSGVHVGAPSGGKLSAHGGEADLPDGGWALQGPRESVSTYASRVMIHLHEYEDASKLIRRLREELRCTSAKAAGASKPRKAKLQAEVKRLTSEIHLLEIRKATIREQSGPFKEKLINEDCFREMADTREQRQMGLQPESQVDDESDDDQQEAPPGSLQSHPQATCSELPAGQATVTSGRSSAGSGEDSDSSGQGGALMAEIKLLESPVCLQNFHLGDDLPEEAPGGHKKAKKTKPKLQEAGTDQTTLAPDVSSKEAALEATEESMKMIQQDVESQAQETAVRHRKENLERRHLDYHHTISDANDTFNQQLESHSKATTTDDQKPPKTKGEILHTEVQPVVNEEVQKVNQEALVYEEQLRIKTEKKSISRLEYLLRDLEPMSYQEHEISPNRDQVPRSNLDFEIKETSSSNVNVSPSLGRTITIQDASEEATVCHLIVTSEELDQEASEDVLATPLIMEHDDLEVPDIKRQHKKLVTPVSAEDKSPSDQGEEAKKTWEHLHETAVRLALHCDLVQDIDQEFETLESGDIPKNNHVDKRNLSSCNKQGDSEEHQEKASHDEKEVKDLSSEENEQPDEVSSVSKLGEDSQPAEQGQRVEKMRRRVHFSPSIEEREQMSEDIFCIKIEGAQEPTTEYTDHPPNLHPRPVSGELPIDKEEDIGFINSNQVIEPAMMDPKTERDQVKAPHAGSTVWYDDLKMSTQTDEETCKSLGDVTYQSVTLGFQSEEITNVFPDKMSLEELSNDVGTVEEMQDSEEEQNTHSKPTLHDNLTHSEVDREVEYDHGEGTQRFDKIDGPLEKSYEIVSDPSNQEGSNLTELKVKVSQEVESQSSEEIKVDLFVHEDAESMKQPVNAEVDSEDSDSEQKLLQLSCFPLVDEDSTEGGITPMTDKLYLHEGEPGPSEATVSVYTPDGQNMQASVQELDTSKNDQIQDDIIGIESERHLSTDSSNIGNVQTTEDPSEESSEGSVGINRPMMTEAQNEEDMGGKEYHDVGDLKEIRPVSEQVEEHMRVTEEYQIHEMDDYMWYKQESYQNDGLIIYSESFEEAGSQKDPTENAKESSEQPLPYEESGSEVNSKDGVGGQLHIVSKTEPRNQSLSVYTKSALGTDDELEGICRHTETGFEILSEIQSVINTCQSEQDVSDMIERSEIPHCGSTEGNILEDTTESKFQIDNVIKDLDLQHMVIPGHSMDKFLEDLPEEIQTSLTSDEVFGDQSLERVKELKISSDSGTLSHSEVILDQNFLSELHSVMSMYHPAEVLEMMSTMKVGQSDKGVEDVGYAIEETLKHENSEESSLGLHLPQELGSLIESVQTFEEDGNSSICIAAAETMIEVSDIGLDTNNTSVEISKNKEEERKIGELEDLDSEKELEILLDTGSPAEDNNEVMVGSNSESYSDTVEGGDDHLSSMDTSVDVIVSTINVGQSDKEVEDVGYSNEETIAEIFSEKITSEHENSEEHSLCLHLSVELGSLIEPEQIFKEEYYSSMGIAVTETIIEVSDFGSDTNNTSVEILEISENKKEDAQTEEDQSFFTLDKTSNGQLGDKILDRVKEPEILLDSGSPVEENIEVIEGSPLKLYSETLEGGDDLLSNSNPSDEVNESPMNVEVSDKWLEDGEQSDDPTIVDIFSETLEHQGQPKENYPEMCFSSELVSIIDLEHSFEEHRYSSIIVTKTQVEEATEFHNDLTETENVLLKEIDPSSEIYNDLILDHTVEKTSESKEEEKEESQLSKTIDDTFRKQFGNLEVHETVIHTETGSIAEYIDIILESTSEHSQDDGVLLSDLHSVKMTDHTTDVNSVVSSTGKEDILDTRKAHDILVESTVPVDIILDNVIPDEQEKGLITGDAVEKTSENKEEEREESRPSETIDDTFRKQFGNFEVSEPLIHTETGFVSEYVNIILDSTSEHSLDEGVLLSDLHSVKMTDHTTDVISVVSSTGKEDILDTRKAHDLLVESMVRVDIIADNVIPDEQGKNQNDTSDICHEEKLGSSFERSQEPEENQLNSSSPIFSEEAHIGLGIVNTAEENVNVLLVDYEPKEMDLLSEIQSLISSDYSVEASTSMSTVEVVEVAGEDLFRKSITTEEKEDSEEMNQRLGPSESVKDLEKKLPEQDSSRPTLSIVTHHSEDSSRPSLSIVTHHSEDSSRPTLSIIAHHSEDKASVDINELSNTAHFGSSDLEIRLPLSMDHIKQEAVEGGEQLSSEEALCSVQSKQVITILTDIPPKLVEPPTHIEMNKDQEKPLVNIRGTVKEPSMEEDDDIDNSLFPHNTLDISAQKSRVQLRRKTSIRRKQGQRQVPSESEPVEPPQPMPRPRPMGVPIFPGKLPIFPMAPAVSHPTEEQKEEKPVGSEEILIKPKKGIPRFGIPHPQMMQELQSRLKKKKPNE